MTLGTGTDTGEEGVGALTSQVQQWPLCLPSPRGRMGAGLPGLRGQQGGEAVGVLPACSHIK